MTRHQELLLIEGSEFRQVGVLGTEGLTGLYFIQNSSSIYSQNLHTVKPV